ncbi:MAG: GntR family transcriptional regulator [Nevskia sp.]|nr:GntR family transcriptional regulator [Nevskia sp.]
MAQQTANALAEQVYLRVKDEIFDFHLLPSDRFTETALAERYGVSRTPVRDALYRLKREGYLEVGFRSGWSVCPFDFVRFDELYDLRILIEINAIERLCQLDAEPSLAALKKTWLVTAAERETDSRHIAELDEAFHCALVEAAGNREVLRVHVELTEKIRIIRRLDFLKEQRVDATYEEHGKLLRLILRRKSTEASILLRSHITQSKSEVRKITLHMLHEARASMQRPAAKTRTR